MLTISSELDRLMAALAPAADRARDMSLSQHERREAWIEEQRLSLEEAQLIPLDYDPAYPYPRESA